MILRKQSESMKHFEYWRRKALTSDDGVADSNNISARVFADCCSNALLN
jgi:hypothetical protein